MIVYTDPRTLLEIYQESMNPQPRPRRSFPKKRFLLIRESTRTTLAEAMFNNLKQAVRTWTPKPGLAIFCEEAGNLICAWRPA